MFWSTSVPNFMLVDKCAQKIPKPPDYKQQGRQTRKPSDSGTRRRSNSTERYKHGKHTQGNRRNKDVHSLETGYETDGESYQQEFFAVNLRPQVS